MRTYPTLVPVGGYNRIEEQTAAQRERTDKSLDAEAWADGVAAGYPDGVPKDQFRLAIETLARVMR